MRNGLRSFGLALFLSAVVFSGVTACEHKGHEAKAQWIVWAISSKLDLNSEQKKKLEAARDAMLEARKGQSAERERALAQVKQMILSEKLDAAQAKTLLTERQKSMEQNFDPVFAKVSEFHSSLTPDQKREAVELIEKFASRF